MRRGPFPPFPDFPEFPDLTDLFGNMGWVEAYPEAAKAAADFLDRCGCTCGDCQDRLALAALGTFRAPGPWSPRRYR